MITVYSTPNCIQCNTTKKYLDRIGLDYIEKSVSDPDCQNIIADHGYKSAPIVKVERIKDTDTWQGFRPDLLSRINPKALKQPATPKEETEAELDAREISEMEAHAAPAPKAKSKTPKP